MKGEVFILVQIVACCSTYAWVRLSYLSWSIAISFHCACFRQDRRWRTSWWYCRILTRPCHEFLFFLRWFDWFVTDSNTGFITVEPLYGEYGICFFQPPFDWSDHIISTRGHDSSFHRSLHLLSCPTFLPVSFEPSQQDHTHINTSIFYRAMRCFTKWNLPKNSLYINICCRTTAETTVMWSDNVKNQTFRNSEKRLRDQKRSRLRWSGWWAFRKSQDGWFLVLGDVLERVRIYMYIHIVEYLYSCFWVYLGDTSKSCIYI